MRSSLKTLAAASVMLCLTTIVPADLRIRTRNTEGNRSYESVTYFKGLRQRKEFYGARSTGTPNSAAIIYLCDIKQYVILDHANRTYWNQPYRNVDEWLAEAQERTMSEQQANRTSRAKGVWTETFNVIDTGERKQMFGYTARHIKTVTTWESSPKSCKLRLSKETDGWYVDLLYGTECSSDISGFQISDLLAVDTPNSCFDFYNRNKYAFERKQVGTARFGFPVTLTIKDYKEDGRAIVRAQEVVEIKTEELDQALFEVPVGYAEYTPRPYKRSLLDRALSLFRGQ
jgi:hypothetical protein